MPEEPQPQKPQGGPPPSSAGPPPNLPTSTPSPPPPNIPTPAEPPQPPQLIEPEGSSEPERPAPQEQQEIRQQPQPYSPDQKRPYLERGEVHTMEKDIARVREEEARKEQRRIAQLETLKQTETEHDAIVKIRTAALQTKQKEQTHRQDELRKIQDSILPPGEERRVRDLPHPPSQGKKVFMRVLIVVSFAFIALNLALFGYWYFFLKQSDTPQLFEPPPAGGPTPTPPIEEPVAPSDDGAEPTPQPVVPSIQDFIKPSHTTTLQFEKQDDLALLLSQLQATEQQPGFTQLLFRKKLDDTLVQTGEEFFSLFGINLPPAIAPQFSNTSFFFSYSFERGNRLGLIVETGSSEASRLALRDWESQIEENLSPLLPLWATKGAGYTTAFRSRAHQGVEIRFQTFSIQDQGIVYALVDKYLIFASSFEAAKAAIEALQPPPRALSLQQALGQVLMIGFEGTTVTPELQDLMKRLSPGGVLLLSKNIQSIGQLQKLTQDLQRVSLEYSSLPLFIAVDQEGGAISRIDFGREKTAQSTIQDEDHAYQVGQGRAEELKFLGVNLNLSPVLDSADSSDFLFGRTFQTGGLETGNLAKALLAGQKEGGILSTLKHFPGYGNISFNPEKKLATVREFPDISPFVSALSAKPEFLLLSNVIYTNLDPDQPFPFSLKGVALIREDLNFDGLILSDDLSQPSLLNNYAFSTIVEAPLKAGVNMIMFAQQPYAQKAYLTLVQLVEQDPTLKKNVEDSAAKIVESKKQLFSDKNSIVWNNNYSKN